MFMNPNDTALLFPLEDGMEVLYPEGGFALNFVRGLGIIFCWMALLAALGLAAASFLSFPVAAFFSLAMLVVVFSSGTLADAVESGTVVRRQRGDRRNGTFGGGRGADPDVQRHSGRDVRLVENFSPIDALSTGRAHHLERTGAGVRADRVAARRHHRAGRHRAVSTGANWRRRREPNEPARKKNSSAPARRRAAVRFRPDAKSLEPRPRAARPDAA